jgi:hypothetical protein
MKADINLGWLVRIGVSPRSGPDNPAAQGGMLQPRAHPHCENPEGG